MPPLLHIGYHKTGTTFLQTGLLADPERGFLSPWSSTVIRQLVVLPSELTFDPCEARRGFEAGLREATARGLTAVVSDERLSGSPHAGGFDSATIADRLSTVFPEAKVLIVIREQRDAIYSVYQQYVRDGGASSLNNYLHPRNPAEVPQFRLAHFEYHHLIAHYQRRFGRERVLVLPFEWLRSQPERFFEPLFHLAGQPLTHPEGRRYTSLSAMTIALKRLANRWLVRNSLNPAAPLYVKDHERRFERLDRMLPKRLSKRLERRWRELVATVAAGQFSDSNRKTVSLTDLPLEELGYACDEGPRERNE